MKVYLASLAVGILVGAIYGALHVRSPAPPVVSLLGLLGILAGEQIPSLVREALSRPMAVTPWISRQVKPHMFGELPRGRRARAAPEAAAPEAHT